MELAEGRLPAGQEQLDAGLVQPPGRRPGEAFATPIVAGTVALCIASGPCAGLTPAQIVQKIVSDATAYNTANPGYGFTGDPQHSPDPNKYYGYLIRASLY